jgi:hypothetical protein
VDPVTVTALLFWLSVVAVLALILFDRKYLETIYPDWGILVGLVAMVLLWRLPVGGHFFHGLEYEDSYVYSVVGRTIALGIHGPGKGSFLTAVCSVGSLVTCGTYEVYSGHYIGFPYVVSLLDRCMGFSVYNGSIASVLASIVTAVALWCMACFVAGRETAIATVMVFAVTPAFATYGVAAFAEPTSNALATVTLAITFRMLTGYEEGDRDRRTLFMNSAALSLVLLMAIVVKRENVVIPLVLTVVASFARVLAPRDVRKRYSAPMIAFTVVSILVGYFAAAHLELGQTVVSETAEYGQYPFALGTVRLLMPVFASSVTQWSWYLFSAYLVMAGIIACVARHRVADAALLLCGAAYLLLYTSHVRSHYMLMFGAVSDRDALRYAVNIMSLWSLLAGTGLVRIARMFQATKISSLVLRAALAVAVIVVCGISYRQTMTLRRDALEDEFWGRINPAQTVVKMIGSQTAYVISPESLLLQLYGPPTMGVVDFRTLGNRSLEAIIEATQTASMWYLALPTYDTDADHRRYREQFMEIDTHRKERILNGEGFVLFRLF